MSRNYYAEINLHLTWHVKLSQPMLDESIEPLAHRAIWNRVVATEGAFIHGIGGTATHIHVAITVAPTITISEFVGQLKGGSAHDVNQRLGLKQKVLQWQSGYGVVSFGTKDLPWVLEYIRNQKEHHAAGSVVDRLERVEQMDADSQREAP